MNLTLVRLLLGATLAVPGIAGAVTEGRGQPSKRDDWRHRWQCRPRHDGRAGGGNECGLHLQQEQAGLRV